MLVRHINQTDALERLRNEMGRLFEGFLGEAPGFGPFGNIRRPFPAMNFWDDDHNLYAEAEVPGLTMDDLDVSVLGNELTIKGERKPVEREGWAYHRRERGIGMFSRSVRLPADIEAGSVQATLANGVLTVRMPKAEAARPRKVEVKVLTK